VHGAPVFDDPQAPGGNLLGDAVVQQNDAIGDVFFQAEAGYVAIALFCGDDSAYPLFLQPAEQALQLGAQDGMVWQGGKKELDRIKRDPFGANCIDGVAEADEKPIQVVIPGFLDLTTIDLDVINDQLLLFDKFFQIKSQGGYILGQFVEVFLEGHKDTGLIILCSAIDQELDGEERLATTRAAGNQGRPAFGQTAAGDFVQTLDSGGGFRQGL